MTAFMEERKRMKKFSILLLALLLVFGSVGNVFATVNLINNDLLIEAKQTIVNKIKFLIM